MRQRGHDVLHLSTALAPVHRERIVDRVRERLRYGRFGVENWTLVATSCVEAGQDFSFRVGFRERCSTASLIQTGGRVSRGDEFGGAEVWDFCVRDCRLPQNPKLANSARVLLELFKMGEISTAEMTSKLATIAMQEEFGPSDRKAAREIVEAEDAMEYPEVAKLCRVIADETATMVVDRQLIEDLENGSRVDRQRLVRHSVQVWFTKIGTGKLPAEPILAGRGRREEHHALYSWKYEYDPDFLGYMAGALRLQENLAAGVIFV